MVIDEPGELGRTLGGGPKSAAGERRCAKARFEEADEACMLPMSGRAVRLGDYKLPSKLMS